MSRYAEPKFAEDPTAIGIFSTGDTVTVTAYNASTGASLAVTGTTATEIGTTGRFRWDLSNLTPPLPTGFAQILVIMTNGDGREHDSKIITGGFPSDSAIRRFQGSVHIDIAGGSAGTLFPLGTPEFPVDNVAQARTIADGIGLESYQITGSIPITTNHDGWRFLGSDPDTDIVDMGIGNSVISATFEQVNILGDLSGAIGAKNCVIGGLVNTVTGLEGLFIDCGADGILQIAPGGRFDALRLASRNILGTVIDFNGAAGVWLVGGFIGIWKVRNMTNGTSILGTALDGARVTLEASNNAGTAELGGVGEPIDLSTGIFNFVDEVVRGSRIDVNTSTRATQAQILSDAVPFQGADIAAILVDTGTIIPALIDALLDPSAGDIANAVWNELTASHIITGSYGEAVIELLNAMVSTALIDDGNGTTDTWVEVRRVWNSAGPPDSVEHERYELYDQDGAAITGSATAGNNPLRNPSRLLAERRRI